MPTARVDFRALPVGCHCHYFDSGSFGHWGPAEEWARATPSDPWGYYRTKRFKRYLDAYAAFIKKYAVAIDYFSNVDVIGNPELTYKNQTYFQEVHDLHPVPVVHFGTDLKWLRRYIEEGYPYIALGGLVGSGSKPEARQWIDRAFDIVCDQPSRLPKVMIHGFGVTTFTLMSRWPWYSVDSARWTKAGAYGMILIPHRRGGKWVFDETPYMVFVSARSDSRGGDGLTGQTFASLSKAEKRTVLAWLEEIGVAFGTGDEYGVSNRHCERKAANLLFFEAYRKSLPEWPWAFYGPKRKGLGLFGG